MMRHHLVVLKKRYIDAVLDGSKTVECRLTRSKRPYFGNIQIGDALFFKAVSGPVRGKGRVKHVKFFDNMTPEKIGAVKDRYNRQILGDDEFWRIKSDSQYAVLVWLDEISPIEPIRIDKKDWRGWVILTAEKNFGLLD